jgi:hypothetical protein
MFYKKGKLNLMLRFAHNKFFSNFKRFLNEKIVFLLGASQIVAFATNYTNLHK